jgi:hypothetical protein
MAGSQKGWALPICSERDPCWSGSIEIALARFGRAACTNMSGTRGQGSAGLGLTLRWHPGVNVPRRVNLEVANGRTAWQAEADR